jgi:hypothetical protein
MFIFKIKADATDIAIPAVRSLLGVALILVILYRNDHVYAVNLAVAVLLSAALLLVQMLLIRFRVHMLVLVGIAALLLLIATHALPFSILLLLLAVVIHFSYVQPSIEIAEKDIRVKKTFHAKTHEWSSFNNIILKDQLLTLDFKNNKVLQLELHDPVHTDEQAFNNFCARKIGT